MKIISLVNFVRGGKSSIARLLAENLGTSILNFDPRRNGEFYNAVKTTNIPELSTVTRKANSLEIDTQDETMIITSKRDFLICDFGGRFDERINDFESDIYIFPMTDDFESINETIRATKYVLSSNPTANIIHVLNMVMCSDKKERVDFEEEYKELMILNKLKNIDYVIMPRSKLIKKLVNDKMKSNDIIGNSNFLKLGAYRKISAFTNKLVKTIKRKEK